MLILREVFSSQMKFCIISIRASSIILGMPWALVKNWVYLPMIIWMISFWPSKVGCNLLNLVSDLLILSIIGSQGAIASASLPSQAPRILTTLWSFAILILVSRGYCSLMFRCCVSVILVQWAGELIGMISVFSILNFTPDAKHHSLRIS